MTTRLIIKTDNPDGIPYSYERTAFEQKHGIDVQNVPKLYVTFKVGKRRKIKRLRINIKTYPCELCGCHRYINGSVGSKEFSKEDF